MIFINMTQLNKIIKAVLTEQTSKVNNTAKKIVDTISNAMSGVATDEQSILNAIKLITSPEIYNSVLSIVKKQIWTSRQKTDIIDLGDVAWDKLGYSTNPKTIMQWIQITDFNPPLPGDINWLTRYSKILSKFNSAETVGKRKLTGSNIGGVESLAGDTIGSDTTAWEDPAFRHKVATVGEIVTMFIPIVGPVISAGIGLADAKAYWDEGDKYTAGLAGVLTLIPAGAAILKLGKGPVKALAKKILSKSTVWSKSEQAVITAIAKNKNIVKSKLAELTAKGLQAKKLAPAVLKTPLINKSLNFILKGGVAGSKLGAEFVKYGLVPALAYDVAYNKATELSDTQIADLNKKLEVDFDQYLEKRYSANISDGVILKTNIINEAPIIDAASEFISGIGPVGGAVAAVAVGSLLFRKQIAKLVKSLKTASPYGAFKQWNRKLRDKNTLNALGVNVDNINDFYKAASDESKTLWLDVEKKVAEGKLTPTEALDQLKYHLPARGTADKIFKRLTKSYNKKVPVDKLGMPKIEAIDINSFIKEMPEPKLPPGAPTKIRKEYDEKYAIWKNRSELSDNLQAIQKDPDYLKWLDMHLKNKNATKMLSQVNKERYAKYAAFWALVGGGFLKTYFYLADLYGRDKHREKLAKLPKTPVTFKKAEGQSISIYKYNAAANTMSSGKGLVYKIRSADKLYKVETSRNTAKWTLIQFPGKEYYWVATTELVDGGGYKEKKPEPDDVNAGFI
jgi:hypothetical protein